MAPAAPSELPPCVIMRAPKTCPLTSSTIPARIAQARLGEACRRKKAKIVTTKITVPVTPMARPAKSKSAWSKCVLRLKWEGTPRHCWKDTQTTSYKFATPSAIERSQPGTRHFGRNVMTQATKIAVKPKDSPKRIGLRQDTSPSREPPVTTSTTPWKTALANNKKPTKYRNFWYPPAWAQYPRSESRIAWISVLACLVSTMQFPQLSWNLVERTRLVAHHPIPHPHPSQRGGRGEKC